MRIFWLMAAVAIAGLGEAQAAPAANPYGLGAAFPQACAAGYHTDAGGNCQPNAAQQDRFCPRGTVYHPAFEGWTCDPPPPEAY